MQWNRRQIVVTGYLFHFLAAVFSLGYHHCDELFQIYEFAGYKLGINAAADLPWEFHERMRSGLQPLLVYVSSHFFSGLGVHNPFYVAAFIRLFQAHLSFAAAFLLLRVFEKEAGEGPTRRWYWFLGLLGWCMPYFHARFSSENFAVTLFVFGLVTLLQKKEPSPARALCAGLLMGLAFIARFHMVFMILGFTGWLVFINKKRWKILIMFFAGTGLSVAAGFVVDHWLYGDWTCSWWNYLDLNLFHDKASAFGREPWYYYVTESLLQLIPPFSIAVVAALPLFWFRQRAHPVTWITLPFVMAHFFVGHKELRFLFPVLPFVPLMVAQLLFRLHNGQQVQSRWSKYFVYLFIAVNSLLLLVFSLKPADNISHMLYKLYRQTDNQAAVLYYEQRDPYNKNTALGFFRNARLETRHVSDTAAVLRGATRYFFTETYGEDAVLLKNGRVFVRIYSSFPDWFRYINVNDWLSRAYSFSIYREYRKGSVG